VLVAYAESGRTGANTGSRSIVQALERADKYVTVIRYEGADYDIAPEQYRIDLLARLTEFLDAHTAARTHASEPRAGLSR
jgi:hypothetical protein